MQKPEWFFVAGVYDNGVEFVEGLADRFNVHCDTAFVNKLKSVA